MVRDHLAAAVGLALVENGFRVLYTRTTDLVQRLQIARRELTLEAAIRKLNKYHLLILDDIAYVRKDHAETSALFELISSRYEHRSMVVTANQPFGEWGSIFPDQAMTLAAVDRLVHRATIFELNVESYRRRAGSDRRRPNGLAAGLQNVPRRPTRRSLHGCRPIPATTKRTDLDHADRLPSIAAVATVAAMPAARPAKPVVAIFSS